MSWKAFVRAGLVLLAVLAAARVSVGGVTASAPVASGAGVMLAGDDDPTPCKGG